MTDQSQNKSFYKKIPAHKIIGVSKYIWLFVGVLLSIVLLGIASLIFVWLPGINAREIEYIPDRLLLGTLLSIPSLLLALLMMAQAISGIFSFLHVLQLCLTKKTFERKPSVIIFRILTVLFGIGCIVCAVLLFTQTICVYDFLRTAVFFFGGSIVLNIFIE